ncbi:hypothetical protein Tco_0045544 [Tanacetum coccineum]
MKMGHMFSLVVTKPGYDSYVTDLHIFKNAKTLPDDNIAYSAMDPHKRIEGDKFLHFHFKKMQKMKMHPMAVKDIQLKVQPFAKAGTTFVPKEPDEEGENFIRVLKELSKSAMSADSCVCIFMTNEKFLLRANSNGGKAVVHCITGHECLLQNNILLREEKYGYQEKDKNKDETRQSRAQDRKEHEKTSLRVPSDFIGPAQNDNFPLEFLLKHPGDNVGRCYVEDTRVTHIDYVHEKLCGLSFRASAFNP